MIQQLLKKAICTHLTVYVIRSTGITYADSLKVYPEQFLKVYNTLSCYGGIISSITALIDTGASDIFTLNRLREIISVYDTPTECFQRVISPRNWTSKLITSPVAMLSLSGCKLPSSLTLSHLLAVKHDADMRSLRQDIRKLIISLKSEMSTRAAESFDTMYVEKMRLIDSKLIFLSTLMGLVNRLLAEDKADVVATGLNMCLGHVGSYTSSDTQTESTARPYITLLEAAVSDTDITGLWLKTIQTHCLKDITDTVSSKFHLTDHPLLPTTTTERAL